MFSSFPYFSPKWFCFFVICLLVWLRAFSHYLLVEFSFVVFKCPVFYLYCLSWLDIFLFFLSFVSIFWFISSSCIVCFTNWVAFFFSSQHISVFYLYFIIFACYCRCFICVSSLIYHPGPCEFFAPVFADCLSMKSTRQQVSSGLQDSSQYSGWS